MRTWRFWWPPFGRVKSPRAGSPPRRLASEGGQTEWELARPPDGGREGGSEGHSRASERASEPQVGRGMDPVEPDEPEESTPSREKASRTSLKSRPGRL